MRGGGNLVDLCFHIRGALTISWLTASLGAAELRWRWGLLNRIVVYSIDEFRGIHCGIGVSMYAVKWKRGVS